MPQITNRNNYRCQSCDSLPNVIYELYDSVFDTMRYFCHGCYSNYRAFCCNHMDCVTGGGEASEVYVTGRYLGQYSCPYCNGKEYTDYIQRLNIRKNDIYLRTSSKKSVFRKIIKPLRREYATCRG